MVENNNGRKKIDRWVGSCMYIQNIVSIDSAKNIINIIDGFSREN